MDKIRATTIVAVKKENKVAIAGDGQVTFGETVFKAKAKKIRKIKDYDVGANKHGCVQESGRRAPESGTCFDRSVERPSIRLLRADVCGRSGKLCPQ